MRTMTFLGLFTAAMTLTPVLFAQDTTRKAAAKQDALARLKAKLANKCGYQGMSCMCKWKFQNRRNTRARSYFLTEKFWNQVPKVCWSEIIQFSHTEPAKRGVRLKKGKPFTPGKIDTPVMAQALEAAGKQNRMVMFIAMTGG